MNNDKLKNTHFRNRRNLALAFLIPFYAGITGCSNLNIDPPPVARLSCVQSKTPSYGDWQPGCATQRNLMAIAADSDDLFRSRKEGPRDAMRRDAVLGQYAQSEGGTASQPAEIQLSTASSGEGASQ